MNTSDKIILAMDVHYRENVAKAVGALFKWESDAPNELIVKYIDDVSEYIPGEFYKRELPCIREIIDSADLNRIAVIIVDSHIYINNNREYGLGGKLWQELGQRIPVIGVAKSSFKDNQETITPIKRGNSKKPLYISSIGIELEVAARLILNMKGKYRLPDILKTLDSVTKEK
ncbi:endonuclease V [Pedobacter glucosidilyticus]|uniref:endonuclease V n=1 Tax=Pedobacter glucosidilyticus TaxID=1122941 RepID=UPI00041D96B5|nr:endonuclease V [Pedobacter glucosidilyticus]